jgi:hypothetical protein
MKRISLGLFLAFVPLQAGAIERYTSTSMTCDRVQATINADGAAIMRYESTRVAGLPVYGRYVRNRQFCEFGQTTERSSLPTSDTGSCPVRKCVPLSYDRPSRSR